MPAQPMPTAAQLVVGLVAMSVLGAIALAWAGAIARVALGKPLLPRKPPRIVPWGVGSLAAVIVLYVLANLGVGLAYAWGTRAAGATGPIKMSPRTMLELMALCNLALLPLVPLTLKVTSGARLSDFGLGRGSFWSDVLRGLGACLIVAPFVYAILAGLAKVWKPQRHPLQEMLMADPTGAVALLAFVSGVILAPAAEELLFRGVLQGWLVRACSARGRKPKPGPLDEQFGLELELELEPDDPIDPAPSASGRLVRILPNVATSMLFAALHHAQWPAPIPLFFLSLALGALYQRTGSLVAPFVMHATFNGLSTSMLYLALLAGVKSPPEPPEAPAPAPTVAPAKP